MLRYGLYFQGRFLPPIFHLSDDASHRFTAGSGRTLRDTALESSPIVKLLTSKFVSTWSLLEDVKVR